MRLLLLVFAVALGAIAPPPGAQWSWPVPSRDVVRAFEPPEHRYGPGHRGIDIAAPEGGVVRAPAAGTVRFAGLVAGRPVVSIQHDDGLISTFEPVAATVARGDAVERGDPIGVLEPGHAAGGPRLHLGARLGDDYVNPLLLLGVERPVLLPRGTKAGGLDARESARVYAESALGARVGGAIRLREPFE